MADPTSVIPHGSSADGEAGACATASRHDHAKKCKGPKRPKEQAAPKPPARASWDDREGSTWIDQL